MGTGAYTTSRGINGAPFTTISLPAITTLPVDNSGYYNRVMIVDLAASPYFNFRYLVLHFNI
ncbi:hypothetical protein D3C71_2136450 [compost metagenome]